jgi:large subunit ribosomal protein L3e
MQGKPVHLTGFIAYKAGMTHIVRELDRIGSKAHKKEIVEAVTILEAPPVVVIGLVGYINSPRGLSHIGTVWAEHLSATAKRRFVKRWTKKSKPFTKSAALIGTKEGKEEREAKIEKITKYAQIVRAIVHTQPSKLGFGQKKGHIMELQVNGGQNAADKVKFITERFEKEVRANEVFSENEMVDTIGITKGHGFEGVTARWGTTKLPRKTHKGLRKVACIGAWHPARVSVAVPRAGQDGYHHRIERNKKIYRIGSPFVCTSACSVFRRFHSHVFSLFSLCRLRLTARRSTTTPRPTTISPRRASPPWAASSTTVSSRTTSS